MDPTVELALPEISALCERLGVARLDLFGSATSSDFDPRSSDVDVLVDLGSATGVFDRYFALKDGLERILGRHVDVVTSSSIRNPYFLEQVQHQREQLYAA